MSRAMFLCFRVQILNAEKRVSVKDTELKITPSTQLKLPQRPKISAKTQAGQCYPPSLTDSSAVQCYLENGPTMHCFFLCVNAVTTTTTTTTKKKKKKRKMGLYSFVPKKKTKVSAQQNLALPTSHSQVSGFTFLYHIIV